LGDPQEEADYAAESVTINDVVHRGALSVYAVTIPDGAPHPQAAEAFVNFLLAGGGTAILRRAGLTLLPAHLNGDPKAAPASVRALAP